MNSSINLLGNKKPVSTTPAARKLKLLRITAVASLFSISAASIILFLLIALSPLPALQKQEQNALLTLSQHHTDVAKLTLINDRLQSSSLILKNRTTFDQTLTKVKEKMPDGVAITALNLNEETISITVSSASLQLLDTFINNLITSVEEKRDFSQVSLTTLFTDNQKNAFTLTVSLVTL